jgi:hypothetical protein
MDQTALLLILLLPPVSQCSSPSWARSSWLELPSCPMRELHPRGRVGASSHELRPSMGASSHGLSFPMLMRREALRAPHSPCSSDPLSRIKLIIRHRSGDAAARSSRTGRPRFRRCPRPSHRRVRLVSQCPVGSPHPQPQKLA